MPTEAWRLDRAVAVLFGVSRRRAAALIRRGEIEVDGTCARDAAARVPPASCVRYAGHERSPAVAVRRRVLVMNKPAGTVCTRSPQAYRSVFAAVADLPRAETLQCVGRLDADTRGLLLLTDDGALNHRLTSPRSGIPKVYLADTADLLTEAMVAPLRHGVRHPRERRAYAPAAVRLVGDRRAEVTVTEGRFHEIKRMFACIGTTVTQLTRVQIGGFRLGSDLAAGRCRELSEDELVLVTGAGRRDATDI